MALPRIILVPTDFGEPSSAALDHAIDLAKAVGSEIVLLHSYELPVIGFPDGAIVATAELSTRILDGAETGLKREADRVSTSGVIIRTMIKQGDPWNMINESVEEIGAGLIVMGTHGRSGIPRMLIGSVAEKVVRTAKVPVLITHAKDPAWTEPRNIPATANGRPVTAPRQ